MRIQFVEISNFRKLRSVRVDFTKHTTLFVGANNSGKTSAMLALRYFLLDAKQLNMNDFTLSNWKTINEIGGTWEALSKRQDGLLPTIEDWADVLPSLDLWLDVADTEIHYVNKLYPTLGWSGGLLGVRLLWKPQDVTDLYKDYVSAIENVADIQTAANASATSQNKPPIAVKLWPQNLVEFLQRRQHAYFDIHAYSLDPLKCVAPENGIARPQPLSPDAMQIEGDPFAGLIRINEINAQRGFGGEGSPGEDESDGSRSNTRRESRKLSDQLRTYYDSHLDPLQQPDASDLAALQAIEGAQNAFDTRLEVSFDSALKEVAALGYPGVTDPRLRISTKIRPMDGLDHDAAVQYEIDVVKGAEPMPVLRLPENYNGLGYQNLISMTFRLMSFRDAWMRVGKAAKRTMTKKDEGSPPPLHLVLIEEPEAHLHAQVQQVFIRKAYDILRKHDDLGDNDDLTTQLVVSTHSSHVAHETPFECLRYFRRLPASKSGEVPLSTVVNLTEVFGTPDNTARFVMRYLQAAHCDLFFADAAVLVEGPAERILVPHFVRNNFEFLNQCYITWLEIGGSHAHRLEPLIRKLGLLTLVITDIDAADAKSGAAVPIERGKAQTTNNNVLKTWLPKNHLVDNLLNLSSKDKELIYDQLSSVRVAYQCPVSVSLKIGSAAEEALPYTFEDALVFENLETFRALTGTGLVKKIQTAIAGSPTIAALATQMFTDLRSGKKAEFALEVLDLKDPNNLKVPTYIEDGLSWLDGQLRRKLVEVLPPITNTPGANP